MRIIVIGATGITGSEVVKALSQNKARGLRESRTSRRRIMTSFGRTSWYAGTIRCGSKDAPGAGAGMILRSTPALGHCEGADRPCRFVGAQILQKARRRMPLSLC
jgi:hypothetical protein